MIFENSVSKPIKIEIEQIHFPDIWRGPQCEWFFMVTISHGQSTNPISSIALQSRQCRVPGQNVAESIDASKGEPTNLIFCIIVQLVTTLHVFQQPSIDLAESLISLGFAKVADGTPIGSLDRDAQLKNYRKNLVKIQAKAIQSRNGIWSTIPPPIWPINVLEKLIKRAIYKKVLPVKHRLPELVR